MMQSQQSALMEGLQKAGNPELYTPLMQQFSQADIKQVEYRPGVSFHWMLFRPNGVGPVKSAPDLIWAGKKRLRAYEFFIDFDNKRYIFAVPFSCGNLALKEIVRIVVKTERVEVPGPERIVKVPGPERIVEVPGPERIVEVPGPERIVEVPGPERIVEVPGPERIVRVPGPQRIVEVPGPQRIVEVPGPQRIVEVPGPERIVRVPGPERIVKVKVPVGTSPQCCPSCVYPIRYVVDAGYLRMSDPANFGFGRIGVEYAFNQRLSFLGMIGGAIKADGSDGDDAWLLDFMLQYNMFFMRIKDKWNPVFFGFGLGGWMSDGDDNIESEDSDIDIIAQVGTQIFGDPESFNTSLFLEARSGIDEMNKVSEYGRFGIGVRLRF
ncbi:MAG: hypothetical protein D3918_04595 [Candidatus Electrothrix sp. AX2]|nr:hypothetical protein [Candidatus Electrothrix gigas]